MIDQEIRLIKFNGESRFELMAGDKDKIINKLKDYKFEFMFGPIVADNAINMLDEIKSDYIQFASEVSDLPKENVLELIPITIGNTGKSFYKTHVSESVLLEKKDTEYAISFKSLNIRYAENLYISEEDLINYIKGEVLSNLKEA